MSVKSSLAALFGLILFGSLLHAQPASDPAGTAKKNEDVGGTDRFWQATLDGGHYMVALDRISAISRHSYLLDGAAIVDEVTVDAIGQTIARFYFIKPVTETISGNAVADAATRLTKRAQDLVEKAADRIGNSDLQNMVVKKYPETTHARSIEYRILSEEDLTGLYESVRTAWEAGKGRKFSTAKK